MIAENLYAFLKGILPKAIHWILQRIKTRKPIEWSIETFVGDHWCVVFPGKREVLSQLEGRRISGSKLHTKLINLGAVDYSETRVRLRLRAKTDSPILVKQISAQASKSDSIDGIKITHPTAGVSDSTLLMVDFDDEGTDLPLWSAVEESFEVRREGVYPFFARKQINLSKGSYETLIIIAKTNRYSVNWTLRIDYEIEGYQGSTEVTNYGAPFRTTGEVKEGFTADLTWAWFDGNKLIPSSTWDTAPSDHATDLPSS